MAQSPRLALRGRRRGTGPERVVVRLYRRDAEPDRGARPCDRAVPELGTGWRVVLERGRQALASPLEVVRELRRSVARNRQARGGRGCRVCRRYLGGEMA